MLEYRKVRAVFSVRRKHQYEPDSWIAVGPIVTAKKVHCVLDAAQSV
jgi:hypothetical protein